MNLKRKIIAPLAIALSTTLVPISTTLAKELSQETIELLNLLSDVRSRIHSTYVEETKDETLIQGAIEGMLKKLDPHSAYILSLIHI